MKKRIVATLCLLLVATLAFAEFKNGVFAAKEKEADKRGYIADIKFTIESGKIVKIEYNEAKGTSSKWADKAYNANMKKISGIAWADAVLALENDLIKKQALEKVDVISGATETTHRFKAIAAQALAGAK